MQRFLSRCLASALVCIALAGRVFAVDGVALIDHNRALAGNVTPGDTAGYPITISIPGSYRLSGNLTVGASTDAITILASHVTIDLNGFAILGPVDCSGGFPCAGAALVGGGRGINSNSIERSNITIRNGTIQGMGDYGIDILGDSHLVEYVHARNNGGVGIRSLGPEGGTIVQHCTVVRNGAIGIFLSRGRVSNNVVDTNGAVGIILLNVGVVSHNVIARNSSGGIGSPLGKYSYYGNVLDANGLNVDTNGVNMGQNLCNGSLCP